MEHLNTRLRDLLLLLLEAIDAREEGAATGLREIHEMVATAGFGEQEVEELLSWLHARWEPSGEEPAWLATRQLGQPSAGSLRQPGPREDELLTTGAFGYLLDLVRTRQISWEQMETLIQFAQLSPDGPLTASQLEPLVERVVLSVEDGRPAPGGRSDRIH